MLIFPKNLLLGFLVIMSVPERECIIKPNLKLREGFQKKKGKVWSLVIPPRKSPPGMVFFPEKILPFLLSEIRPLMGETNFTHGANPKLNFSVL